LIWVIPAKGKRLAKAPGLELGAFVLSLTIKNPFDFEGEIVPHFIKKYLFISTLELESRARSNGHFSTEGYCTCHDFSSLAL
jgi:hypothetical protein